MPSAVLWFATDAFIDTDEQRAERVNEAIGGAALALWLAGKLRDAGLPASEPWAEDHGWDFAIKTGSGYTIVCTIEDVEGDERQACVQVHAGKPGRGSIDAADPVLRQITALLEAEGAQVTLE